MRTIGPDARAGDFHNRPARISEIATSRKAIPPRAAYLDERERVGRSGVGFLRLIPEA
jgi:hypothetical protein